MALLVAVALLAVPVAADAGRLAVAVASGELVAGPVLAGSQVMYVVVNGAGRGELWAGRRRVADVGRYRNESGYKFDITTSWSLSASPAWVAVARSQSADSSGPTFQSEQIFVGRPGGPLSTFASCTGGGGYGGGWEAQVDGDRIAVRMTDCPRFVDARLVVRDLASGSDIATIQGPHLVLGGGISGVSLAGDYLAWSEDSGRDVVVYDLMTASELYRVHDIYNRAFDLQADGKVVTYIRNAASVGAPGPCDAQLVWYGPDDPLPHQISACPLYGMRLSGGRVLYRDHLASDYALATNSGRGELKVATLDQSQPPKTLFSGPVGLLDGFSFDGSRATYGIRGCTGVTIYVDDLSGPDAAPETVRPCRLSFASRRATADRHRVVSIPLACPSGCDGTLLLRQGRRQASATAALATPRVRVRLRRWAWTQLLKRRALRVRAIAVVTQPDLKETVVRATLMIRAPAQ
jgi:hypothetical protein